MLWRLGNRKCFAIIVESLFFVCRLIIINIDVLEIVREVFEKLAVCLGRLVPCLYSINAFEVWRPCNHGCAVFLIAEKHYQLKISSKRPPMAGQSDDNIYWSPRFILMLLFPYTECRYATDKQRFLSIFATSNLDNFIFSQMLHAAIAWNEWTRINDGWKTSGGCILPASVPS